jgi:ankyrin repeat protein
LDDKNPGNKNGMTLLEMAAGQGHLEVVQVILDLNPDPTESSDWTESLMLALDFGHECGHPEVVNLLQEYIKLNLYNY